MTVGSTLVSTASVTRNLSWRHSFLERLESGMMHHLGAHNIPAGQRGKMIGLIEADMYLRCKAPLMWPP